MKNPKILIVFYSMYGHIFELVKSAASGVTEAGGSAVIRQVQELVPESSFDEYSKKFKSSIKDIPIANPATDLKGIDGLMIATPTRYGNMTAQMKFFLDQTVDDWLKGTLIGKPASVITSSATQHGGQESTILSSFIPLLHQGCIIVGLPYSNSGQMRIDEITGGSPYGASTITGGKGERMPSQNEMALALSQGKHLAEIARKLMS